MRLYDRIFRVEIGEAGEEARAIENLSMKFEIQKSNVGVPNAGFVEIFNLSDATESFIQERGEQIRVFGGYPGVTGLLFNGDIRKITRGRTGPDRITRVELGGNVRKLTRAIFSRSYSGNVSIAQIVQDALPSFALSNDLTELLPDKQKSDFAFDGRTSDLLDRLLLPNGVTWHESDGVISFSLRNRPDDLVTIPVLRAGSGLVGIPGKTDTGVNFRTLLNPYIQINKPVKLESGVLGLSGGGRDQNVRAGETDGIYKIKTLVHKGETRGQAFYTEAEAVEP